MDNYNLHLISLEDIKEEEKRLHEEYKRKLSELKKIQKEKESVGQVFTKGLLPIYVLHILSIGPSNGNDIANKIGERTNGLWIPSTGGIYPLLKKLEKDEYVIGEWDDPKKKFQKVYSLTQKGIEEYESRKHLLKPKIEEALKVFKIIYKDLYK
ncbi:PadR family transcriptional regulator [Clostridium tertium]|jgi:DNA-binding PadR family transcriptional regulator|uniref:PadR family transcriptional regulator n=1 Tax=Clostridium TaxID=1485 RepID=UPI000DD0B3E8|nr:MULTISPECIES: PadR family transcriptional regulator [Clostridium]MBS5307125.1 PadR family transcriptional regulator [Clostridium sp.]MDB1923063.1 PadR family transcriptional regulator [Clostridium tertium]MDB1926216.1 PadR family transcriptional regulator [Clostridium tertium]MDB1930849.1 PadR family transcriptional regulator [Clostridium tertium]MDB1934250.1 PadR family transcriptional regulator [Clostridium tertium]